ALDVRHELAQLATQLAPDRVAGDDVELRPDRPDVGGDLERRLPARLTLLRPRDPLGERRALHAIRLPAPRAGLCARRAAPPQLVEDVGRGHDPDHLLALQHRERPDRLLPHDLEGLVQRHFGRRGLDPRGHELAHRPPLPDRFALAAAQILDGEDAHEPAILHHDQVPDPLTLHTRPRLTRSLVGSDGHEVGRHDVAQFHRSPSLAAVGISWPGPRGPGFGSRSKAATEALYARGRIM